MPHPAIDPSAPQLGASLPPTPVAAKVSPLGFVSDGDAREAPIAFRCDALVLRAGPNRTVCRKNVVIRRGDLWVCCDLFEAISRDDGSWQQFECRDNVRAQRGSETVWAQRATFVARRNDLVLSGRPLLRRGDTWLEGDRVVVDLDEQHARIARPRGHLLQSRPVPHIAVALPQGPLPSTCPLPAPP